ncbi:MAG TPA: heterodisulfide reductase-related iron-sulfur binding cluster [Bacillota bacterium]
MMWTLAQAAGEATREVQWNVTPGMVWLMYGSMAAALAIFGYGFWRRVRIWRLGKPEVRWDRPWQRLGLVFRAALLQGHLFRERIAGYMHTSMYFAFILLFVGTVVVAIHHDLGIPIMRGHFYLYFQSLVLDLAGVWATAGIGIALWRRYVLRVPRLEQGKPVDGVILATFFAILVTGYVVEGIRIVITQDIWGLWSPFGYLTGLALSAIWSEPALLSIHRAMWVVHMLVWHVALAAIPFTKMAHMITSPLNIFFANLDARSIPPAVDFDDEQAVATLGLRTPLDFTWKQLLDLDACTECGLCQSVCPAFAEGKPLSPKRVVLDLRDHVRANAETYVAAGRARAAGQQDVFERIMAGMPPLAPNVIQPETLWACTTCRACEEICPVEIEHVPLIVGLRRNLAMEQAQMPEGVAEAVQGLEVRQHPIRGAGAGRSDWYRDLPVREMRELEDPEEIEVLYWVGCAAAFDERLQKVARALVRVMDRAGVKFAVLGPEEQCNGDVARRTGNEFHYDMLARANIETLQRYKVKRIVAHCPHCLQTLGNDYRQLGGFFEVVHHTQFVQELIDSGRLEVPAALHDKVTYHDPCYLGRYNRVFDEPRAVLDRLGVERVEMARSGPRSFCCGAGGGHAFFEDHAGGKVNRNRAEEAVATGATTVCTACPFCLPMLEDGLRSAGAADQVVVKDFVELVDEALTAADAAAEAEA